MRTVTVVLAGQEYTIAELPARQNAAWRQRLNETLTSALVQELLVAYAPQLEPALADPALYDSEVLAVFREVLALGNPFGPGELRILPGAAKPAT